MVLPKIDAYLETQAAMWMEASKRSLGTVWHKQAIRGKAHCDHRLKLIDTTARETPPENEYVCKRCRAIDAIPKKES